MKQIEGEWIIYRGDQFEIKKISNGKVESTFYDWKGNSQIKRSANLKLTSDSAGKSKTLIKNGEKWQYLAGGNNPNDSSWTGLSFDAEKAGWKTGEAGFGYADNDDKTVLDDMQNKYTRVFIRKEFEIPEGADLKTLGLLINYDDAFVLHANGRRLFNSSNLIVNKETGEITVNNHEANNAEYYSLNDYAGAFKVGKNVIAIEGHNTNLESSDFTLDPELLIGGSGSFVETNQKVDHESPRTNWFHKNRSWNGKIDDLRIWGRALSDDEIAVLWNKGKGTNEISKETSKSLIGHWPFDGNLKDVSGKGRDAKGHNSPGFTEGKIGKALELNGENQYVTLGGKSVDYTPDSGSITISLWFSANKFDKRWQTLIAIGDAGWSDWRIHRHNLTNNISYSGGAWVRNNTKINDGEMHHVVAVTEKDKEVRIYIDNILVSNSGNNGIGDLGTDEDGWLPAVGANLQGQINLSIPLEGEFIPMQDSLRITAASSQKAWVNDSHRGLFRKVDLPDEALLIAARKGDLEKVRTLLKAGVDPDTTSRNSYTALAYASIGGHLDIMKLLISENVDVNKAARFNKTPLLVTAGSSQIEAAKLLIANGAKTTSVQMQGAFSTHESCIWGQPEMLEFLLKYGMDPNLRNGIGNTAIHYAIGSMQNGQPETIKPRIECIKLLLKHGANPELRGGNDLTPIQWAKNNGLDEAVKLLQAQ
ncbi:ankyrin repeat domain-containing protein [bacterium]|nr:ankyrin repeat domain-containing protein [bacterium]